MDPSEFIAFVLGEKPPTTLALEQWLDGRSQALGGCDAGAAPTSDVFFSAPGPVWTIGSDSDEREVRLQPSVAVLTSEARRNCFWRLTEPVTPLQAQGLLSYLDPISPPRPGSEGWRLPGTQSLKRRTPFTVCVDQVTSSMRIYSPAQIMALPSPDAVAQEVPDEWIAEPGPFVGPARAYVAKQENTRSLLEQLDNPKVSIPGLLAAFIRRRFNERDAIWIVSESAAARAAYAGWKYGVITELAKVIITTRTAGQGNAILRRINAIRGDRDDRRKPFQIREDMAKEAMKDFNQRTSMLHEQGGRLWAVEKQSGVAMELGVGAGSLLSHYITKRYGINPVDIDHKHLVHAMVADAAALPAVANTSSLSYYDRASNQMMVSFGGREVAVLGAHGISFQENGTNGVIMQPITGVDPIATRMIPVERALDRPPGSWWESFMPPLHLGNLQKGTIEEVSCLLHVWTVFCLFRNLAASRPILTWLGPASSGKSTSGRKINVLFYGMGVKLFDLDSLEHWQVARSNYPVTIWDNVDTPTPRWFGQGLAKSISDSVFVKRRLWSNNEPYQVVLDSMVGLSAHDADFLREDIIDRMILIQFRRFDRSERLGETEMIQEVVERREEYLAGLMADVIHVLKTERLRLVGGSSIRVADFSTIGRWIAGAIGPDKLQAFDAALANLSVQQTFQVLEEDALLIDALNLVRDNSRADEWFSAPQLWMSMVSLLDDNGDSLKRVYKNPQTLSRRLSAIHAQVSEHMAIETREDEYLGRRVWRFRPQPIHTNGRVKHAQAQAQAQAVAPASAAPARGAPRSRA